MQIMNIRLHTFTCHYDTLHGCMHFHISDLYSHFQVWVMDIFNWYPLTVKISPLSPITPPLFPTIVVMMSTKPMSYDQRQLSQTLHSYIVVANLISTTFYKWYSCTNKCVHALKPTLPRLLPPFPITPFEKKLARINYIIFKVAYKYHPMFILQWTLVIKRLDITKPSYNKLSLLVSVLLLYISLFFFLLSFV